MGITGVGGADIGWREPNSEWGGGVEGRECCRDEEVGVDEREIGYRCGERGGLGRGRTSDISGYLQTGSRKRGLQVGQRRWAQMGDMVQTIMVVRAIIASLRPMQNLWRRGEALTKDDFQRWGSGR